MPKIVDYEDRRNEVVEATWRVIARDGIGQANMRAIAREVGWSTGVLAHYFRNKDDIIKTAIRRAYSAVFARASKRAAEFVGAAAVFAVLSETLPLDLERRFEDLIQLAFWGRTIVKPELRDYQGEVYRTWWELIRGLVRSAEEAGEIKSGTDSDQLTTALIAIVDGTSVDAMMFPDRLPPQIQLKNVRLVLEPTLKPRAVKGVALLYAKLLADLSAGARVSNSRSTSKPKRQRSAD